MSSEKGYLLAQTVEGQVSAKQGRKCCGCCCDMRRAVIVVNIVNLCSTGLELLGLITAAIGGTDDWNDDAVPAEFRTVSKTTLGLAFLIVIILATACSAVGLIGARKYDKSMVGVGAGWYCVSAALSLISLNVSGLVYNVCFAYPHFYLMKEIKEGIMTEENYPVEKYSCCCV
ncbi:hypothetical protein ACA910_020017 [Epithemia clementina (nom. ined.)]